LRDERQRIASTRELSQVLERYLDGERDDALRKSMAEGHAVLALQAADRAARAEGSPLDERKSALRQLGRALALDPTNADALSTLVRLLTLPPQRIPPEVEAQLEGTFSDQLRWIGRFGQLAYASLLLYLPLLLWCG